MKKEKSMQSPLDIHLTIYQNESELLDALRRGERSACTCLFKRFAQRLYTLAAQLMGEKDEVDDVVQESFIQACRHINAFEGKSSLGTWLHRITYNTAMMHHRRHTVPVIALEEPADEELSSHKDVLVDELATPEHAMLTAELQKTVQQAIDALPPALRSALVLRMIEGMSTKEAAERLGIEEAALKVRLHRARQQVRQHLTSYL
jgi:RNA polymerase sigma-70 factor (ECF subfamily)